MTTWIQTYTGQRFDVLRPTVESIDIRDIAHALSNLCRFTGHTRQFYSVAQHSYLCAARLELPDIDIEDAEMIAAEKRLKLWALLHDASEAYISDIASPVKYIPGLCEQYRLLEDNIMGVICQKYGLESVMPEAVRIADARMLSTEKRDLLPVPLDWGPMAPPYSFTVVPAEPFQAREHFLNTFKKLRT